MDFLSPGFRSLELADVRAPKEEYNLLQPTERASDMPEKKDQAGRERRRPFKPVPREKGTRDDSRIITLHEVAWHDKLDDCWLVIYDYVYDCTEFLSKHPGGEDILLEYAGRDATLAFIDTGHSALVRTLLDSYKIGELPLQERIFRVPNGVKVSGF